MAQQYSYGYGQYPAYGYGQVGYGVQSVPYTQPRMPFTGQTVGYTPPSGYQMQQKTPPQAVAPPPPPPGQSLK